jgi:cyclin H
MPDAYGIERALLEGILDEIQGEISSVRDVDGDVGRGMDMMAIKGVDKRLRMCTNPEKTPGTALYVWFIRLSWTGREGG